MIAKSEHVSTGALHCVLPTMTSLQQLQIISLLVVIRRKHLCANNSLRQHNNNNYNNNNNNKRLEIFVYLVPDGLRRMEPA
jgi:hypothetical protein